MGVRERVMEVWQRLAGLEAAAGDATAGERKTAMLPAVLSPYSAGRTGQSALPKPTPANLRKFAETPLVRRAINVVKDKVASMESGARRCNSHARMAGGRPCMGVAGVGTSLTSPPARPR